MVLWEKKLSYVFCFFLKVFKSWRTASASFYFFFYSVNYRRIYSIHLKNLRFAEDVLFYPKNEVMAFPKIKIKWDWVSDVHVYIKSNAIIWFDDIVMWEPVKHLRIKLDPVSRVTGIPGWYWILGIKCSDTTGVGLVYWNSALKSGQGHTPISKHRHAMRARVPFL